MKTEKAFPHREWIDSEDPQVHNPVLHAGMDLRDYFAAAALTGLCANYEIVKQNIKYKKDLAKKYGEEFNQEDAYMVTWIANSAYQHADEMMKKRKKLD